MLGREHTGGGRGWYSWDLDRSTHPLQAWDVSTPIGYAKKQYPHIYETSEQFFRSPTFGEVYYEVPILERSITMPKWGPVRAIFNDNGEVIGVVVHKNKRSDFKQALEYPTFSCNKLLSVMMEAPQKGRSSLFSRKYVLPRKALYTYRAVGSPYPDLDLIPST